MWWYRLRDGRTNFGDELGAEIVTRMGYAIKRVYPYQAELIACGSILHFPLRQDVHVWGSGLMSVPKQPDKKLVNVHALRGTMTRACLKSDVTVLGDPGVLASRLWDPAPIKKYRLGIIPHYIDKRSWPNADKVIDVTQGVDEVIKEITECETIASSSLHGLIVAQSFGIPAMRLPHPGVGGGDFKWLDYTSAMGRPLGQVQDELMAAFPS